MEEMVDRWKTRVDGFDLQWCHVLCVSLSWQISEYIIQAYKNGMFQKVLLFVLDVFVLTVWRRLSRSSKDKVSGTPCLSWRKVLIAILKKRKRGECEDYEGWWLPGGQWSESTGRSSQGRGS